MTRILTRILTALTLTLLLTPLAPAQTALTSLTPAATEVGTVTPDGDQAGKINFGSWFDTQGYWPDHTKIVAEVPADFALPEGKAYRTRQTDAFMVAGEPLSGVGIAARNPLMYHWVEFALPQGVTTLTGRLLISDDVTGYTRGYRQQTNQNGTFVVTVDGTEVFRKDFLRAGVSDGSGEKLADLNLTLPADAKVIRFRVENSGWGDGNNNCELILNEVTFN